MLTGISCNFTEAEENSKLYDVLQINIGDLSDARYPDDDVLNNIPDFKIPIFIHSKLTYNISKRNINYPIKKEMIVLNNQKYGQGIIIHLSKWYESSREAGLKDVVDKIETLLSSYNAKIILENSYHMNSLGSNIDDFAFIFKNIKNPNLNICLDTSHLYLTWHPINRSDYILEYLTEFEIKIGLEKIKVIHLNDIESVIFGKHTPHLNIGDGLLFKDSEVMSNKSLNFIISLSYYYDIPIILERQDNDKIMIKEELDKIEEVKRNLIFKDKDEFDILIKNSIVLYFVNKIIDYNDTLNLDNDNMNDLKNKIFSSYTSKKYKLVKVENSYKYNFDFEYSDLFYKIINEKKYNVFDYLFLDQKYLNIKELLNISSIGPKTIQTLLKNGIESLDQLKNEPLSIRRKVLTPFQQKVITNLKFIRLIDYEVADEIVKTIKKSYTDTDTDIHFYGSYFRIKNNLEEPRLIKDIDILCVGDSSKLINVLKSVFNLKVELYTGNEKKSFVFSNKKGNDILKKIHYFTIEVYICKPEEFPFMSIYLKGPVKRVKMIYSIAKAKGYKMNNKGIYSNGEKIDFETEKDVLSFLNIKT